MKVYILAPEENWIVDRIAKEFSESNPKIITNYLDEADVIWAAAGWCWNHIPFNLLRDKKILLSVHHEVPEKFKSNKVESFRQRDQFVDHYHVPNKNTKRFISDYTEKNISVVSYWYDGDFWNPLDKNKSRDDLGISRESFIVGSFQRDTEGSDLITPKLEKGPDIFCDYVEKLNKKIDNVHVLLGGWRRQYVISRLDKSNIPYTFYELAPLDTLKKMYASCDLYVVGSRQEGGPQSILEASAMKIPIISNDVGIASNVLSQNCIINVQKEFYLPTAKDVNTCFENVKKFELKKQSKIYIDLLQKVAGLK